MPVTVASTAGVGTGAASDAAGDAAGDDGSEVARALAHWLHSVVPPGAVLRNDSRRVERGDVFFAYPGGTVDGRGFISQAVALGAGAILWERDGFRWPRQWRVPNRALPNLRRLCGPIAAEFHRHPSRRLKLVAVTGTNGKTSCSHWIAQGLV
ncbi:MAG TPA: Mur ligase domain-containing protein, partial [Burkholderiaceae bacterium]|nr:Mur ligase domain-containing protein [Burkholderiaceae bacterium]